MKTKSTIKIGFLAVLAMIVFFTSPQAVHAQSDSKVYEEVDELPVYPGGMEGLVSFMVDNLKYPKAAKKDGVTGTVIVSFHVEKDGAVSHAEILRGIGGGCDEEALRIVNQMEKWQPGKKDGETVITALKLPVKFAL
ncbi:energy transducer TonB [Algoriphagus namhaensis]|uniref:Energy transducer TonB n=1 Tax=Algoriphagus namhaensis TaxID=915353 RepID=A0ABV8AVE7_9BACT